MPELTQHHLAIGVSPLGYAVSTAAPTPAQRKGEPEAAGTLRSAEQARAELRRKGVPVTQWALANGFSPNLVFEVLAGRRNPTRGQTHEIAVALGLKAGEIVTDAKRALA